MDDNLASGQNAGQMNGGMPNGQMNAQNFQPQPQMMKPPKQPMDPVKKKKLILGITLGLGGVIAVVVGVVIVLMLLKVDYGESYRVARELKPKVSDLNGNYDCTRVVQYASDNYPKEAAYNDYVSGCATVAEGVDELVMKLGQTPGVQKDKELKAQFDRFKEAIDAILPNEDELKQRLEIYKAWHKFSVVVEELTASKSSDAEIQNAAKILIESGNEILATYGEGWLEKTMVYVQAYRAYNNASYSDSNKSNLRLAMNDIQTERKNWLAENKPDIAEVGGLSFESGATMYAEFTKLYEMITDRYEKNYDDSGDCTEFLGEVFCS